MNHGEIVSFIWGVADLIRDTFRRGRYQDVILPLTVLRRLDCVLAPTKDRGLRRRAELRGGGLQNLDAQLRRACKATSISLLMVIGVRADGQKALLAIRSMDAGHLQTFFP